MPEMTDQENKYCPNCGAEVHGRYCHECGQDQKHYRVSVRHILDDFASTYLTFDSKLFRSIIPLLFQPGYLTNEYLAGKRVSFIRPLRMYLFASFVFFFVLSLSDNNIITVGGQKSEVAPADSAIVDSTVHTLNRELSGMLDSTKIRQPKTTIAKDVADSVKPDSTKIDSSKLFQLQNVDYRPNTEIINLNFSIKGKPYHYQINRNTFKKNFIGNLPTMMFFLLPIFALFLKLLYIRRERLYVEHLVFSLYTHAFVFLISALVIIIPWGVPETILNWSILVYMYIAMKQVYSQGYFKTFVKFAGLLLMYFMTLGVSLLVTMVATVVLS